ncbi:efflux RND transporter periplasmic adaptor subunit [Massilia horti]|uniref:Efflux RND transporter periplasmic adaptor subunit n=2 Tax=Massilia horti TaxID=2562153 RepID=A0A4Y9SR35_9BURK|nr:efflux RND transporter periplasmic adaptor subunit [Massilia horti]
MAVVVLPLFAALLASCSKPEPKVEDVRPVRTMTVTAADVTATDEFAGDVRPRFESRLGFRVGGKIVARKVDVGAAVVRGQVLMQLDPQDLKLGQAQALASLRVAETNRDLAQTDYNRYKELLSKNFVSQEVLESKAASLKASQANVDAARAVYHEQSNQSGYARLVADSDGVVTGIDAEVGQVVAPGTPVVRIARTDEKEVVIGVPEGRVDELRKVEDVSVRLWADRNQAIPGKIREISPMADPATRTYTVKIMVPPNPAIHLGMTATVQFAAKSDAPQIHLPLTALVRNKGATGVWVVENNAVHLVPVQLGGPAGNDIVVANGLRSGQIVVTAGVNRLRDGQKVKILTADVSRRADTEALALGGGAAK